MKYAKSIYRAEFIVNAEDCDYESSKELGLICPFCSQAVFMKRSYLRGFDTLVSAAFCHYHTDDPMADDCELRSQRPDGQEFIKQLEKESKNQRLKLFNDQFTNLALGPERLKTVKIAKKNFGGKWCEQTARACRHQFSKDKEAIYKRMVIGFDSLVKGNTDPAFDQIIEKQAPGHKQKEMARYSNLDKKLHLAICAEAVDFLGTRTSGYAFEKLFLAALTELLIASHFQMFDCAPMNHTIPSVIQKVKSFGLPSLADYVGHVIFSNQWIERVQEAMSTESA